MNDLEGRTIVVTGAGGNMGSALMKRLVAEGARVWALERREDALERALAPLGKAAGGTVAELTNGASLERALDDAEKAFGPLWGAVHTAGAWQGGKPLADTGDDVLATMIDANLRSTLVFARAAMHRLRANGGGRLVNVGALTAASSVRMGGAAAYNATKAGVIALSKALAEEGKDAGIRVNCIAPGTVDTPQNRAAMPDVDPRGWVRLEEIVEAMVACLRPASGLNGAVLLVPGRD